MRVVAGTLRGRQLKAPPGDATRPTGARVKEALFSVLGDVGELRVLDLYAGSGALGIEALSRGARQAVFVEAARPALLCLRDNLSKLGLGPQALVLATKVEAARRLLSEHGPFELVFCDPPWKDALLALSELEKLAAAQLFSADARIAFEHSAKEPTATRAASSLEILDTRRWGDTAVTLLGPK